MIPNVGRMLHSSTPLPNTNPTALFPEAYPSTDTSSNPPPIHHQASEDDLISPAVQQKIMELMHPATGQVGFNQFNSLSNSFDSLPLDPSASSENLHGSGIVSSKKARDLGANHVLDGLESSIANTSKVSTDVDQLQSRIQSISETLGVDLENLDDLAGEMPAQKKLKVVDNTGGVAGADLDFDDLFAFDD